MVVLMIAGSIFWTFHEPELLFLLNLNLNFWCASDLRWTWTSGQWATGHSAVRSSSIFLSEISNFWVFYKIYSVKFLFLFVLCGHDLAYIDVVQIDLCIDALILNVRSFVFMQYYSKQLQAMAIPLSLCFYLFLWNEFSAALSIFSLLFVREEDQW